ncbi:MAG: hypothetical protein ACFCUX_09265 [Candidatus Methylacidiphilales bacterium]
MKMKRNASGAGVSVVRRLTWTPQFKVLAVLGVFMWWASVNYSNNAAYAVLFLLVSLVLVSAVEAWTALARMEAEAAVEVSGFAGEEAEVVVRLRQSGSRAAEALRVWFPDWEGVEDSERVARVRPGEVILHRLILPLRRRGVWTLQELRLESCFPLGFWKMEVRVPVKVGVTVYPCVKGERSWPEKIWVDAGHEDEWSHHRGEHFAGHRRFEEGESERHVDWRAFSRGKGKWIKDYRGGGQGCVRFALLDLEGLETEERLSQLAKWVVEAGRERVDFVLDLGMWSSEPGRGEQQVRRCLERLAAWGLPL